jgi:hypothetical protein
VRTDRSGGGARIHRRVTGARQLRSNRTCRADGIDVLDHIIVTNSDTDFFSMRERGVLSIF